MRSRRPACACYAQSGASENNEGFMKPLGERWLCANRTRHLFAIRNPFCSFSRFSLRHFIYEMLEWRGILNFLLFSRLSSENNEWFTKPFIGRKDGFASSEQEKRKQKKQKNRKKQKKQKKIPPFSCTIYGTFLFTTIWHLVYFAPE